MTSKFAVVGHPNKGKSSLVATLAQNDRVLVSELSGTTIEAQYFNFRLNGETCYQLIDTPGFQRARKLLEELKSRITSVTERKNLLQNFVADKSNATGYPDEYQLLRPILDGAAIIYLVDGATPYSSDYEPEMEILQWTGQPRMAVINPIGGTEYVDQWMPVLDQYFSTVRIFDPLKSDFKSQMDLLGVFGTLRTDWKPDIEKTLSSLEQQRIEKISQAARVIMATCESMLQYRLEGRQSDQADELASGYLYQSYCKVLRKLEQDSWKEIKKLFVHHHIEQSVTGLNVENDDLFDEKSWQVWGLPRKTIIMLAAGSGAASGALVDVALGGTSLMLGAAIGSVAAGSAATLLGKNLAQSRIAGILPLGKLIRQIGPIKNPVFAWAILGRQIFYASELLHRNHARRDVLDVDTVNLQDKLNLLNKSDRFKLTSWLTTSGKKGNPVLIQKILETLISQTPGRE